MNRIPATFVLALLVTPAAGTAQEGAAAPAGPLASALSAALNRAARNMPAAAELMPPDKYGFKPTPEQMSFGSIIAHEAQSNERLCAALGGTSASTTEAAADAPKADLVVRIRASFESCRSAVAGLSEGTLGDSVSFFGGRKATKARVAVALAQDWADHYAQAAMYLRLNGILPPSARPRN